MADLYGTFSSLIQKLKPKGQTEPEDTSEPIANEAQLQALDDAQLKNFISQHPERTLTRLLHSLTDQALQVRVVQMLDDEAALKRVSRSQFDKKVKRAAEKRLRETGTSGMELRLQKFVPLNEEMQDFFAKPNWANAPDLLARVSESEELGEEIDPESSLFQDFQALRERLKREIESYERTCSEMDEICQRLESSQAISKPDLEKIRAHWQDLTEPYTFTDDFTAPSRFEALVEARMNSRGPTLERSPENLASKPVAIIPAPVDPAVEANRARQKLENEQRKKEKEQAAREIRAARLEKLLKKAQEIGENLTQRQAGSELGKLRGELNSLRSWRREFGAKLDEIEALIKAHSNKLTEVANEAKWDTWARTDLAIRIQSALEQKISAIESEQDPVEALKNSLGLTAQLQEYAQEMRSLGSLERRKDHKIWVQFKSLSDRGWAVCNRMRGILLDRFKMILSEHVSKPIEFTAKALTNPRHPIQFKAAAFEGNLPDQIKELRMLWLEIGTKSTGANRELESVFARLYEMYTRQMNLKLGHLQRAETSAVQNKRDIVNEMKLACEGASPLLARAQVAKRFEEKWKKTPHPDSLGAELTTELVGYQAQMNSQIAAEIDQQVVLVSALQAQAQEVLDKILAKSGMGLSQALKSVSGFEAELANLERHLSLFRPLVQAPPTPGEAVAEADKKFGALREQVRALIQECKQAATKETRDRAEERIRVVREAEALALSTDWDRSRARFDELRTLWKQTGAQTQAQEANMGLVFENVLAFYLVRYESRTRVLDTTQREKQVKARKELIYSLEALTRFRSPKAGSVAPLPLPFSEEEMRTAPGKLLAAGMKYKQILALDPASGITKETKKIMEQWTKTGSADDESLPSFWKYYLDRIHTFLEIRSGE